MLRCTEREGHALCVSYLIAISHGLHSANIYMHKQCTAEEDWPLLSKPLASPAMPTSNIQPKACSHAGSAVYYGQHMCGSEACIYHHAASCAHACVPEQGNVELISRNYMPDRQTGFYLCPIHGCCCSTSPFNSKVRSPPSREFFIAFLEPDTHHMFTNLLGTHCTCLPLVSVLNTMLAAIPY